MLRYIARFFNIQWDIRHWHTVPISDAAVERVLTLTHLSGKNLDNINVLDFGCGSGRYLEAFVRRFNKDNLHGVDTDEEALAMARAKGFKVLALDEKKTAIPFPDESFDFIFSSNVIEHIPYDIYLEYVRELHRVAKPDCVIFVGAPNYPAKRFYDMKIALFAPKEQKLYYFLDDPTHCNRQNVLTVEKKFSEYFRNVEFYATELAFERILRFLKKPYFQNKLRVFGYKFVGVCVK